MSYVSHDVISEPVEIYGENPEVFAEFTRAETNAAIWKRSVSSHLLNYLHDVEACPNHEILTGTNDQLEYVEVGKQDFRYCAHRTITLSNNQALKLHFDARLDREGIDYFIDDVVLVLNSIIRFVPLPVKFDPRQYPAIRFHPAEEVKKKGFYGPIKDAPEFHQDWIPREISNQGKGFNCVVNYIGPTTQFVLGSAYNSIFKVYKEIFDAKGPGRHHLDTAVKAVFPNESDSSSFFTSVGLYNAMLFAHNNIPDDTGPIYFAPTACMHRVPLPKGTRLNLVVHGYTLQES